MRLPTAFLPILAASCGPFAASLDAPTGPPLQAEQAALPESVDPQRISMLKCGDLNGEPVSFAYTAVDQDGRAIVGARVGWYDWQSQRWEVLGATNHEGTLQVNLPRPARVALLDGFESKGACVEGELPTGRVLDRINARMIPLTVQVLVPEGEVAAEAVAVSVSRLHRAREREHAIGRDYPLEVDGLDSIHVEAGGRYRLATSHPTLAVECVGLASRGDCAEPGVADEPAYLTVPERLDQGETVVVRLGDHGHLSGQAVSIETGRPIEGAEFFLLSEWRRWSDAEGSWSAPLPPHPEGQAELRVPGHTTAKLGFFGATYPLLVEEPDESPLKTFHQRVRLVHVEDWDYRRDAFPSCGPSEAGLGLAAESPMLTGGGYLVACPASGEATLRFSTRSRMSHRTVEVRTVGPHTTLVSGPYPAKED